MLGVTFVVISSILWGFNGILLRKGLERTDVISGTFTVVFITSLITFLFTVKDFSTNRNYLR